MDRWLMPITRPLYAFVFQSLHIRSAEEIADEFRKREESSYLKLIVQEIIGELNHPTQRVKDMYRTRHSESELREFLGRFVAELDRGPNETRSKASK